MKMQRIGAVVVILVAAVTTACASAPRADVSPSPTPTASPTQTAVSQPTVVPTPTPAPASAYLDDRSSPEAVIRSYYDAVGRHQYLRAFGYWESSATLPTIEVFEKSFADTNSVQVELGTVGGSPGAGQLYWSVPAAVSTTTTAGAQSLIGCFTVHLARPEIQTNPPFKPMAIQTGQLSSVASAAAARSALATVCGSANSTVLPWGAPGTGIDPAHYLDDRSAGEALVRSYYNAVNRKEYSRAYGYWEAGAPGLSAFADFAAGYANTKSVALMTKPGTSDVGAGQTYYSVPAVVTASNADGSTAIFAGCYTAHLASPNAQATPPFRPLGIQSARIAQAAPGSNPSDLLNSACP